MARLVPLVVLGALLAPAQASAVTLPTFQYTGQLEGTTAFVGIVKKGERFRAYVSDATAKRATLSVWFRGDVGPDGHVRASVYGVGLEGRPGAASGHGHSDAPRRTRLRVRG
jgi:hypothetical protein